MNRRALSALAISVGVCLSAMVTVACGSGGSASFGSAAPDPQATVHRYPKQGFSIAYGPGWQATRQSVPVAIAGSSSSGSGWRLILSEQADTGGSAMLTVTVVPEAHDVDAREFQTQAKQTMGTLGAHVETITVNGTPAVMTSSKGPFGSETITLASGRRAYILGGQGPTAEWDEVGPKMLAIMQTFKLLPTSPAE